jgi:hypothetical protein
MLEQPALLLLPWNGPPASRSRVIVDAATRAPLGVARFSRPASVWSRWLKWTSLEVCETADLALLCHVRRLWGRPPPWFVRDADDRLVGRLQGPVVSDALGRTVAIRDKVAGGGAERFLSHQGVELGMLEYRMEELVISFGVWLEGEPFTRMLLLAAAVTSDVDPARSKLQDSDQRGFPRFS